MTPPPVVDAMAANGLKASAPSGSTVNLGVVNPNNNAAAQVPNIVESNNAGPARMKGPPRRPEPTTTLMDEKLYGLVSLDDLLASMDAHSVDPGEVEGAIMTVAQDERIDELEKEALNDERYGLRASRAVNTTVEPANFVRETRPANVTHVPSSAPRPAQAIEHAIPVVRNVLYSDSDMRDLAGLARGANSDARREGSLAASVLHVVGPQEANAIDAPLMGLATRIIQARMCAETGATAANGPNIQDWDIQVIGLNQFSQVQEHHPDHLPVYIPNDMPQPVASALLSLLLPGGAGAYGWRFRAPVVDRPPANPRATYMPSYARWLHPGGTSRIIAVFERPAFAYRFGGASLTVTNLRALEAYYRRQWGNFYFDHAARSVFATGHVYVNPDVQMNDASLGQQIDVAYATTTHNANDLLGAPFAWTDQVFPDANPPEQFPWQDLRGRPPQLFDELLRAARALIPPEDDPNHDDGPIPPDTRPTIDFENRLIIYTWRARGHAVLEATRDMLQCFLWLSTNTPILVVQRYLTCGMRQERNEHLVELYEPADFTNSVVELDGFRNAYGYNDKATLAMPGFDLRRSVCLIAGVHRPDAKPNLQSNLTADVSNALRIRASQFVLKLHIAHVFTCAQMRFWPDDADAQEYGQRDMVAHLPKSVGNLSFVADASRHYLSAPNWQILEPVHYLKGTNSRTAYYSYNVPGRWYVDHRGNVEVNALETSYPALDAALRLTWAHGGAVDITNIMEHHFVAIRDLNGFIAPLSISPVAKAVRRLGNVIVAAGIGLDALGAGANTTYERVAAM